jgi:capsular polysaccharide biosynthesis protein
MTGKLIALRKKLRVTFGQRRPICTDVEKWALNSGKGSTQLHPPIRPEIERIANIDAAAAAEFERHKSELSRWQTLCVIENARVRNSIGLIILPDGHVCLQGNWHRPYLEQHSAYFRRRGYRVQRVNGDAYSLLSLWSSEYFHWLHDVLPRLYTALPKLPKGTKFIINAGPKRFQIDSLAALGIRPGDLLLQNPSEEKTIERLWFASPLGHSTFTAADTLRAVGQRLRDALGAPSKPAREKIYISRRKATSRRVLNEDNIVPVLETAGFKVLVAEEMDLRDQTQAFARARCVLGPHGAGLINMIFCNEATRVGEIIAIPDNPCYLSMAHQLGFTFRRFTASSAGSKPGFGDMIVDPKQFEIELESFL